MNMNTNTNPHVIDHEHWWSSWYPQDRGHHYRYCQNPFCTNVETREATA